MRYRAFALLTVAAAALVQTSRYEPARRGVQADNQLYYYVSERVASGIAPHVSLVDHKHQLPSLLSGLAIYVGRKVELDDVFAARALTACVAVLTVLFLFELAYALTNDLRAAYLTAIAFLGFRSFFLEAAIGFRPQLFMAVFSVAAHLSLSHRRHTAAGVLAACAFLSWQPALLVLLSIVFALIAGAGRNVNGAARVLAGFLAAVVTYEAYFFLNGALYEQISQSYMMAIAGEGIRPPALTKTLTFIASSHPVYGLLQPILSAATCVAWFLLIPFALIWPESAAASWARSATWRSLILCTAGAMTFTFVDHQAYPDRFFYLPYVAVFAGVVPAAALRRITSTTLRGCLVALVLGVYIYGAVFPRVLRPLQTTLLAQRELASELDRYTRKHNDSVWVVGRPDLLAQRRKSNWTPFGMLLDARVRAYASRQSEGATYRPFRDGQMPEVIVAARMDLRRHLPWLKNEYLRVDSDRWTKERLVVYERRP